MPSLLQEWQWAADLIEQAYPRIWGNSDHARHRRWLEQLPPDVIRSRPRLCLAYAKAVFMVSSSPTMQRWLDDAEIAAQRAIMTGYYLGQGHATLAFCQQALAHLSRENLLARAEVAYAASLAHHSSGDIVADAAGVVSSS